jgi:hypothetical protein
MEGFMPLSRLLAVALGLATLVACGVNEENYLDRSADTWCSFQEKCYRAFFNDNWDDMGECVDDYIDDSEDLYEDLVDDCDFDPEKADKCLDSYREATRTCDPDDVELDDCFEVVDDC